MVEKDFLENFRDYEQILRKKYGLTKDAYLSDATDKASFARFRSEVWHFPKIRNLLSHQNNARVLQFITIKPQLNLDLLKVIKYVTTPQIVIDNCVMRQNIISATFDDEIMPFVRQMDKFKINSIPIIENGYLVGLFLESSMINLFADEHHYNLGATTKFRDISEHIKIKGDEPHIKYIARDMTIEQLYDYNEFLYKNGERVQIYFITENGRADQRILGLLTRHRISTFPYGGQSNEPIN